MALRQERRSGNDRRQEDVVPPGRVDKRKRVEARKPEIVEVELSESEWEKHFGCYGRSTRKKEMAESPSALKVVVRVRE